MYPQQSTGPFGRAHPLLVVGVVIFILPFINHWKGLHWIPGWFTFLGGVLIVFGAGISIYELSND